jgi:hypothetical protein
MSGHDENDLRFEEDRSSESSERSGDISGLFADDSQEGKSDNQTREFSEVLTQVHSNPADVSILINSGNHTGNDVVKRGESGMGLGRGGLNTGGFDDNGTGRSSISDSAPVAPRVDHTGSSRGRPVSRGELSSAAEGSGTTSTEQLILSRRNPSAGGDEEVARGLTDQSRVRNEGLATQVLPAMSSQVPPAVSVVNKGENGPQDLRLQHEPHKSVVEERRGMEPLEWEEDEHETHGEDQGLGLSAEETLRQEVLQIKANQDDLEGRICELMEEARELSLLKSQKLELLESGLGEERVRLLRPDRDGGRMTDFIFMNAEDQTRLELNTGDLLVRGSEAIQDGVDILQGARLKPSMSMDAITGTLDRVSERFASEGPKCVGIHVTEEQWECLRERHVELRKRIVGQSKITKRAMEMFPKKDARDILDWYNKLEIAVGYLRVQRSYEEDSSQAISVLLDRYPGPSFKAESGTKPRSEALSGGSLGGQKFGSSVQVGNQGMFTPSRLMGGGSQKMEGLRGSPSYSESEVRRMAADAGLNFRLGGAGPGNGPRWDAGAEGRNIPKDVPRSLIRNIRDREPGRTEEEEGSKRQEDSRSDFGSFTSEESEWKGESDSEIKERIRDFVKRHLEERGIYSPTVLKIITGNLSPFRWPALKNQASTARSYSGVAKNIKVSCTEIYISVNEWWKKINDYATDNGWSPAIRIRFLANTGGLNSGKVYETRVERVKALMAQISEWMPRYDGATPGDQFEYWTFVWVEVGLKFIEEFHQVQPTEMIEGGLQEFMRQSEYLIKADCDDFLNTQFHKVHAMFVAMNVWLRERSSALVDTPLWTWRLLVDWLDSQTPAGPLMMVHVKAALRKLGTDPEMVIPVHHGLTALQLQEMRVQGGINPTEKTYELILRLLKQRALQGDLVMEAKTLSQLSSLLHQAGQPASKALGGGRNRGSGRSSNSVTTDSVSAITMNTTTGGNGGDRKFSPCETCGMFHLKDKNGKCRFVNSKNKHKTENMADHRSTTEIKVDGSKQLSKYWEKKYIQYLFPKLNYSQEEADRAIKELKAHIGKLPKASRAEIEKFAKSMELYTNLAEKEDRSHINQLKTEMNTIVNFVSGGGTRKSGSKKSSSRSSRVEEVSDSSDSEEGSDWESDGEES